MPRYIVRLWVDLAIETENAKTAKEIADKIPLRLDMQLPIEVGINNLYTRSAVWNTEIYDVQTGEVQEKE